MKGFDRLHIKSAVQAVNSLPLDCDHETTLDFGQVIPLYATQLMPRDKFDIYGEYFARLSPLVKPTYGRCSFRTMSVFVPAFQVADEADAFFMNQSTFEGNVPNIRHIDMLNYVTYLVSISNPVTLASGDLDGQDGYFYNSSGVRTGRYEFKYIDGSGNTIYRVFDEPYWKWCLKVLFCLGFSIPSGVDLRTSSSWYTKFATKKLNVLKLLCFAKAFNDWMCQSQRYNTSELTYLLKCIRHNVSYSNYYNASTYKITNLALAMILRNIRLCVESDYFSTAWRNPNSPLETSESRSTFVANNADAGGGNEQFTASTQSVFTQSASQISALQLDWLDRVYRYIRRNNYSGSRTPEKLLSRFGIKSEDFKSNYAHILARTSTPIRIGDVTATAQTNDSDPSNSVDLGDYAGKGIMQSNSRVKYTSKDFGYIFVLGWFTLNPVNAYGFDRDILRESPNDFYQPEFDGLGPDAISYMELFTNPIKPDTDNYQDDAIFGFTERYNSYRFGRDLITGDFRDWHKDGDMNCWHFGRLLNEERANGSMLAQSGAMNTFYPAGSQFNRIFAVTDSSFDHFMVNCQFKVDAVRPMLNSNQVPRLGEGSVNIARNGNEVN